MKKLNVIFFGTPDIAVPSLATLFEHQSINLIAVVSQPDRPAGRGKNLKSPEVIEFAKEKSIPIIQTENVNKSEDFQKIILENEIDFFVVFAFAQFLGSNLLSIPKLGAFNIHTSLLPLYRGAAPIQYAIKNGDTITGVSIQKMVKKMDAGDVAISIETKISPEDTGLSLYNKLKELSPKALKKLISDILENNLSYTTQDESKVTFAPTLKKEMGKIDFKNSTYEEINNLVRAFDPWPGTYCFLDDKRLKIKKVSDDPFKLEPGKSSIQFGSLLVGTKSKTIRLESVQLEGKKACSDSDLLNGLKNSKMNFVLS